MALIPDTNHRDAHRLMARKAYVLILIIAAAVAATLCYGAFLGNLPAQLLPMIEAADQIKIEVTLAQLETGTTVPGDLKQTADNIRSHYDRAENLIEFLSARRSGMISAVNRPHFKDVLERTREQIKRSRMMTERWLLIKKAPGGKTNGPIDTEFDKLFPLADEIHAQAGIVARETISDFRKVQFSLIAASILLAFLAGLVIYRFDRRRAEDYEIIRSRNQQLQASDQQLRASNQQLQATEQQLRASNQQLQATEQQLRASNQQLHATEHQLRASNQQLQANEQALRSSESRYRFLFGNMSEAMALYSIVYDDAGKPIDYRIVDVNRQFEKIFSVSKENAAGRLAAEVFGTDNLADMAAYGRVAETGEVFRFERYFPRLDRHFLVCVYSPEPGNCATVFTDITGQKKAADASRRDALRFETLMRIAKYKAADVKSLLHFALGKAVSLLQGRTGYIYLYDEKTQTFTANTCVGRTKESAETGPPPPASLLAESGILAESVQQLQPLVFNERPSELRDGEGDAEKRKNLQKLLVVPVIRSGRAIAVACIADKDADFDDHDAREFALLMDSVWKIVDLRREQEERGRLEARLQKLESVGVLAGGIAHDFNNLLTAVLANVTFAKVQLQRGEPIDGRLEEIERAGVRAQSLTQQLLTFAKGGKPVVKLARLDSIIRDSALLAVSGSNVQCRFRISEDLCSAEVDAGQISQVINNVTINAVQAMPMGGAVTIQAENTRVEPGSAVPLDPGRYVRVSVSDNGIGILPQHLDRIFDPYFTTKQRGSGLGLAISHSVIAGHRGHIAVESRMGQGTTFHVYLPASCEDVTESFKRDAVKAAGSGRVLVMDDEEMLLRICSDILKRSGYEVETVQDGRAAVERYEQRMKEGKRFDLVILDLTVPGGMGGQEAIQLILKIDPNANALVSSGYSNDPVMSDYASYGFRGLIPKPYSAKSLTDAVNAAIRSNRRDD